MSDLTTLAAMSRIIARARERYLADQGDVDPNGVVYFDLLLEEIANEMKPRPPDRWGDAVRTDG